MTSVGQIAGWIFVFALVAFILTSMALVFGEIYDPLHCKYADMQMCYYMSVNDIEKFKNDPDRMENMFKCLYVKGIYNITNDTCYWKGDPA